MVVMIDMLVKRSLLEAFPHRTRHLQHNLPVLSQSHSVLFRLSSLWKSTLANPSWYDHHDDDHSKRTNKVQQEEPAVASFKQQPRFSIPDFDNARAAYQSKTTAELVRAWGTFQLCQIPFLARHSEILLQWTRRIFGGTMTDALLKATLFGHFCAGEDETAIRPVVKQMEQVGIGSILDYAAENDGSEQKSGSKAKQQTAHAAGRTTITRVYDYESEAMCDAHVETFTRCIHATQQLECDGYAAIKVTALGNPKLLQRMSSAIVEAKNLFSKFDKDQNGLISREEFEQGYRFFFHDADTRMAELLEQLDPDGTGNVDYITWSMSLNPRDLPMITKSCREIGPLALATPTDEEIQLMEAMFARGHKLAQEAALCKTRLLIDAEQVRFQPAIDHLVLELQREYNATDKTNFPIIYNTYQCYLKDALDRLRTDVERSERFSYHFGAKLVRGAYMESERDLALRENYPSPIHNNIEDTHACYNDAIQFLLMHNHKSDSAIELMVATHNRESVEKALQVMADCGVDRQASTICFAQLYGMSDNLTYNLGQDGFRAYKYVPYGEVHHVMPYLLRRAKENSAVAGQAPREISMIQKELVRRIRHGLAA